MNEINIAKTIINKRKEKGITQEELASYMGISKASVSKWETGQSYPDIMLLPQLAAYFNISLDELMDYKPQMIKEDIKKLYHRLARDFTEKTFDEVFAELNEIIKKYYSCFPLLLQMGLLILNHVELATLENKNDILQKALSLFLRVKDESNDVELSKQARYFEAICYISLNEPFRVLELLEQDDKMIIDENYLLSTAFMMTANMDKALEKTQISIYQYTLAVLQSMVSYLQMNISNPSVAENTLEKIFTICKVFDMKNLHPATMISIYITSAQFYIVNDNKDKALDMLSEFNNLVTSGIFPLMLKGDMYFDKIDNWLQNFDLGNEMPRNSKTIEHSILSMIQSSTFEALRDFTRYKHIVENLNLHFGG